MARSKGRTEHFEPSNVVGLDTRIWQERGSANRILGAVFTMAGEIVKIDGLRKLVDWDTQVTSSEVVRHMRGSPPVVGISPSGFGPTALSPAGQESQSLSSSVVVSTVVPTTEWTAVDNPFAEANERNKIFTIGTFTWGRTTEIMVAWGDEDTVSIGVVESNDVRLLKSIEISTKDVRPEFYPRFVDIGQYVIILVSGHAALKWDGKILTDLGLSYPPEPIAATVVRGTKDVFYTNAQLDRGEAGSARLRYFQTYINKYGQESELSAQSNEIFINDYFGLFSGDVVAGSTEVAEVMTDTYNTLVQENRDEWGGGGGIWTRERANKAKKAKEERAELVENARNMAMYGTTDGSRTNVLINAAGDIDGEVPFNDRAAMVFLSLGSPPEQMDIVERAIYRSVNGQTPTALPRRLGAAAKSHFDVRKPSESSVDPAPSAGSNWPPPLASWAFPFRGRVYYGGMSSEPSTLYYSAVHRPEAVNVTSFIEVASNDADRLTGWGVAQDYALVFKRNSVYLLTHDKTEFPILTPLQSTFGAITDRAVTSIGNRTYFMSDVGIHVFDGSKFERISKVLDDMVRALPLFSRDNTVMWSDAADERVYVGVSNNPGSENNEVWVIHTDTGAFSRIGGREVTHGISYKGESIVALYNNGSGFPDLYLWGGGHQIDKASHQGVTDGFLTTTQTTTYLNVDHGGVEPIELGGVGIPAGTYQIPTNVSYEEEGSLYTTSGAPVTWPGTYPPQPIGFICDSAGITEDIGGSIHGEFETEWLEVGDPNTDKRFYKIVLYFVQTGNVNLDVEWCVDWDDRTPIGSTTVRTMADDATMWAMADDDGNPMLWEAKGDKKWDKRRIVSKTIDLSEAHGKCIRFRFSTGSREDLTIDEPRGPFTAMPIGKLAYEVGLTGESGDGNTVIGSTGGISNIVLAGASFSEDPYLPTRNKPKYEPWRLVGWHLFLEDHGVRSRGTAGVDTVEE